MAETLGRPIWYELMTPDPQAVEPFYRAVLGWAIPAEGHAMPNGSEYRQIGRADGGAAGGVLRLTPEMVGQGVEPAWFPYFNVADIDAAHSAALSSGGTVTQGIHEVPSRDFIFTATDPAGAAVAFVGPKGA